MTASNAGYTPILSQNDLDQLLDDPSPLLLFKHSTACPVSAHAFGEFERWLASDAPKPRVAMVRVIEERPISREIASRLGVTVPSRRRSSGPSR